LSPQSQRQADHPLPLTDTDQLAVEERKAEAVKVKGMADFIAAQSGSEQASGTQGCRQLTDKTSLFSSRQPGEFRTFHFDRKENRFLRRCIMEIEMAGGLDKGFSSGSIEKLCTHPFLLGKGTDLRGQTLLHPSDLF
jgi:hypothetical protein